MTRAPFLIIAVGNPSRGDDALGPLLLHRLRDWVAHHGREDGVELLEDFQLQVEHALDLQARERVLFVDAGAHTPPPYTVGRIQAHGGRAVLSHALPPEEVLATYARVFQQAPPASFVLCISGAAFELGAALSREATRNLEAAYAFAIELLQAPDLAAQEQLLTARPLGGQ